MVDVSLSISKHLKTKQSIAKESTISSPSVKLSVWKDFFSFEQIWKFAEQCAFRVQSQSDRDRCNMDRSLVPESSMSSAEPMKFYEV